ncbi:MAG: HAMP domain-containing sensor histidine kinase [Bacteroidales bacterium]|jgi:signal transduction histidine kinase
MQENPKPKYFNYTELFIKVRWVAVLLLIVSAFIVKNILKINIQEVQIYFLSLILIILNFLFFFYKKSIIEENGKFIKKIKQLIHFQVSSDLIILTLILHFSGGVENPFIIYYIFHMIIVSIIFSPKESYTQTCFALFLVGTLAFLECYSVIPHYKLIGFVDNNLYFDKFYLFTTGFVFVTTSIIVVALTNFIVSESRKNEEAYLKANEELNLKDILKNEYVLRVTHDIKGHLAAIKSCLDVVSDRNIAGSLNSIQEEFINRAGSRTGVLADFVKDILNITKKRLEKSNVKNEFVFKDVIDKTTSSINVNIKSKKINFITEIDKNINVIYGNSLLIEEMLINLLLNAIKYTPENGTVKLIVKNRIDDIIIEVSDNGIGIPEYETDRIFDEFFRASNVINDTSTGTGLGLSIVKQIVDDHNGKIWVESILGKGSKFTIILPKKPEDLIVSKII